MGFCESEEVSLRSALQAEQKSAQEVLREEESAKHEAEEKLKEFLEQNTIDEHTSTEAHTAGQEIDQPFAVLQSRVATLLEKCAEQETLLREGACEIAELTTQCAESRNTEEEIRAKLTERQVAFADELNAAVSDMHAKKETSMQQVAEMMVSLQDEVRSERD